MNNHTELNNILHAEKRVRAKRDFDLWSSKHAVGNWKEFPSNEDMLDGIKDGQAWLYIPTTYLNGLINYVDIIGVVGKIDVGEDDNRREIYIKNLQTLASIAKDKNCDIKPKYTFYSVNETAKPCSTNGFHTNVADTRYFPNIQIFGKGAGSYWWFDSDTDGSDCGLCRMREDIFADVNEALCWFITYIGEDYIDNDKDIRKEFYSNPDDDGSLFDFIAKHVCDKYIVPIDQRVFGGWITL